MEESDEARSTGQSLTRGERHFTAFFVWISILSFQSNKLYLNGFFLFHLEENQHSRVGTIALSAFLIGVLVAIVFSKQLLVVSTEYFFRKFAIYCALQSLANILLGTVEYFPHNTWAEFPFISLVRFFQGIFGCVVMTLSHGRLVDILLYENRGLISFASSAIPVSSLTIALGIIIYGNVTNSLMIICSLFTIISISPMLLLFTVTGYLNKATKQHIPILVELASSVDTTESTEEEDTEENMERIKSFPTESRSSTSPRRLSTGNIFTQPQHEAEWDLDINRNINRKISQPGTKHDNSDIIYNMSRGSKVFAIRDGCPKTHIENHSMGIANYFLPVDIGYVTYYQPYDIVSERSSITESEDAVDEDSDQKNNSYHLMDEDPDCSTATPSPRSVKKNGKHKFTKLGKVMFYLPTGYVFCQNFMKSILELILPFLLIENRHLTYFGAASFLIISRVLTIFAAALSSWLSTKVNIFLLVGIGSLVQHSGVLFLYGYAVSFFDSQLYFYIGAVMYGVGDAFSTILCVSNQLLIFQKIRNGKFSAATAAAKSYNMAFTLSGILGQCIAGLLARTEASVYIVTLAGFSLTLCQTTNVFGALFVYCRTEIKTRRRKMKRKVRIIPEYFAPAS